MKHAEGLAVLVQPFGNTTSMRFSVRPASDRGMRNADSVRNFGFLKRTVLILAVCAAAATASSAQTYKTLVSFNGTNGANPYSSVVQGVDGKLYGTTYAGGTSLNCGGGCGTIFKINSSGTLTTIHNFDYFAGDGVYAGLVLATNGNFYGTTDGGGTDNYGTVFKSTSSGTLTTLHSFDFTDGEIPAGGVVQATNNNFYGTTDSGGAFGYGTVFKITPTGTVTTLYSFCPNCPDGSTPYAGLIQATDGNLYGTTDASGINNAGTVFKITPSGTLTTIHQFCTQTCADGSNPYAPLVQGSDGNLYGTTYSGGAHFHGTVFKITLSGTLTTLYSFCVQLSCEDGSGPTAGLIQATDGNFYGTTLGGGTNSGGTIFKITPTGTLTTLHNFCGQTNCSDGNRPLAGLFQATDGTFYGTTQFGGVNGDGTVFRLSTNLGAFVAFVRPSGSVGQTAEILGQGFSGASAVSFNGVSATFTVKSNTYLTATVPTGATSGQVTVTTPHGTLTSNTVFRVLH
ncbi:MAG TPA: choice-of-anchor tandem repeat GloVer-containing protein [Terriglobales bacterium]|nr:choice-of-anchor tandem repeat GloVer-containing protein [Terriglobales bacterium]